MQYEDWRSVEHEELQTRGSPRRPSEPSRAPATGFSPQEDGSVGSNVVSLRTSDRADSRKVKIFGQKAALTVEASTTRHDRHTVTLDTAAAKSRLVYDWANKIIFQFTVDELPILAAVLMGVIPEFEFKFHGAKGSNNKSALVSRKDNGILVKLSEGAKFHVVTAPPGAAYHFCSLVMSQLHAESPTLDGGVAMAQLRSIAPMIALPPPRPAR